MSYCQYRPALIQFTHYIFYATKVNTKTYYVIIFYILRYVRCTLYEMSRDAVAAATARSSDTATAIWAALNGSYSQLSIRPSNQYNSPHVNMGSSWYPVLPAKLLAANY